MTLYTSTKVSGLVLGSRLFLGGTSLLYARANGTSPLDLAFLSLSARPAKVTTRPKFKHCISAADHRL